MNGYCKLFSSILGSTIWNEPHETVRLWITMLALKNRHGVVEASVPGLAHYARISVEECEAALAAFQSGDRYSRTKDYGGRRIKPVDGGWVILNHEKYREKMNKEDRAEQMRAASARYRAKKAKKLRRRRRSVCPDEDVLGDGKTVWPRPAHDRNGEVIEP